MNYGYYIIILLAGACGGLILGLSVFRLRRAPGAYWLAITIFAAAFWSLGYALELISQSLSTSLFWAKIEYLAIPIIAPAWFMFVIEYRRQENWFTQKTQRIALLGILPAITILLV